VQYDRVHQQFFRSVIATFALLLLSGCSTKNPDALTGANVDENLAMMNADSNSEANASISQSSQTRQGTPSQAGNASDVGNSAEIEDLAKPAKREQATDANGSRPEDFSPANGGDDSVNQSSGNLD
jgi:hypothetical protein